MVAVFATNLDFSRKYARFSLFRNKLNAKYLRFGGIVCRPEIRQFNILFVVIIDDKDHSYLS